MSQKLYSYFTSTAACLLVLLTLSTERLGATHIVGSDISIQCLGNDFYQIDLTVRRDCINGADDAPFDDPAAVGIFDYRGNLLDWLGTFGYVEVPLVQLDTIEPTLPPNAYAGAPVCVEEARYRATVFLPFRENGYVLAYQRCCRNATLNNIVDPLNTGTTSFAELTETTLTTCNSMPVFGQWPDLLICANEPLVFEHPATDADGDSLSYSLYTPHAGATEDRPKPVPPPGPDYNIIEWAQGFGLGNLLGGERLQVDPVTGTITAVPNTIGQYLVGVMVTEWRDGEILSRTRRNFEYNVRACGEVGDPFCFAGDTVRVCEGDSIALMTCELDDIVYTWLPDDGLTFSDTVTNSNPIASPDSTITYTVIATITGDTLADTSTITVVVDNFPDDFDIGVDSLELCRSGERILSIEGADSSYTYEWSPGDQVITVDPYSPNDPLFMPTEDGYIYVTVTNGACVVEDSVYVIAIGNDPVTIDSVLMIDSMVTTNGDGTITLTIGVNWEVVEMQFDVDSTYWTITTDDGTIIEGSGMDDIEAVLDSTTVSVTLCIFIIDTEGCTTKITRIIVIRDVDDRDLFCFVSDTIRVCEGDSIALLTCDSDSISYTWLPDDGLTFADTVTNGNPMASPDTTITYTVIATVVGDTITDTSTITVVVDNYPDDFDIGADSLELCRSGERILSIVGADSSYTYEWSPGDQVITVDPYSPNDPLFMPTEDGYIYVTVTNGACVVEDSVYVIAIGNDPVTLDSVLMIDSMVTTNGDGTITLTIGVNWEVVEMQFDVDSTYWTITTDDGTIIEGSGMDTIEAILDTSTVSATVCIFIVDTDGCTTKITRIIRISDPTDPEIEFLADPIRVCFGDTSFVVANPNSDWTYTWEPEDDLIFEDPDDRSNPRVAPTESRTYYVTVSNGITEIMDSIFVEAIPELFDIEITSGEICSDTAIISATNVPDNGEYFFEWSLDAGFDSIVAMGGNVVIPVGQGPVTVYVRGIGADICGDNTTSITLEVDYGIVADAPAIDPCVTNQGTVSLMIPDTLDLDILWAESEFITTEDLTSTTIDIEVPMGQTDDINLSYMVTDDEGCVSTHTVTVPVTPGSVAVEVTSDVTDNTIDAGESVTLSITPAGGQYTYTWDDGTTGNPRIVSPTATTTYTVNVVDTDTGCEGQASITITVREQICDVNNVGLPNSFSPNNDGVNDVFRVRGDYDDVDMQIVDRWGREVYRGAQPWNGMHQNDGKEQAPDSYAYCVRVVCPDGSSFLLTNYVNLIR